MVPWMEGKTLSRAWVEGGSYHTSALCEGLESGKDSQQFLPSQLLDKHRLICPDQVVLSCLREYLGPQRS